MDLPAYIPVSKQQKQTIAIGKNITITNPQRVVRVGYPMSMDMAIAHVKLNMDIAIKSLFTQVGLYQDMEDKVLKFIVYQEWPPADRVGKKTYNEIVKALAYEYLHQAGFGGNERSIYTKEYPDYQGKKFLVADKKIIKTGRYYPPGGDQEDWYPGGLSDSKTHVLLKLWDWNFYCRSNNIYDEGFWVESCNVKLG